MLGKDFSLLLGNIDLDVVVGLEVLENLGLVGEQVLVVLGREWDLLALRHESEKSLARLLAFVLEAADEDGVGRAAVALRRAVVGR